MLTSIITIGSQTNAIRAQKCLLKANIKCEIIKKDRNETRGCIYALRVLANEVNNALNALDTCNINYVK